MLVATARADDPPPADTNPDPSTPPPDDPAPAPDPEPGPPVPADITPPDTVLDSTPAALVNSSAATFAFHSTEDGSTFQCSLDGGSAADCSSPLSLTGLAEGAHTLSVSATDAAGNADVTPESYSWTVDTVAPAAPTGLATASIAPSLVELTWTAPADGDVVSYTVLRDGAAIGTITAPGYADATVAAPASYVYTVVAVDQAGNVSQPTDSLVVDLADDEPSPDSDLDPGSEPGSDPGISPDPAPAPAPAPSPPPPSPPAAPPAPTTQEAPAPASAAPSEAAAPSATADATAVDSPGTALPAAPRPARAGAPGYRLQRFVPDMPSHGGITRPAVTSTPRAGPICKVDDVAGASAGRYSTLPARESRPTGGTPAKRSPAPGPGREVPTDRGGSSPISGSFGGVGGAHAHGGEAGLATRVVALHRGPVGRLLSLAQPTRRALDLHFLLERPG